MTDEQKPPEAEDELRFAPLADDESATTDNLAPDLDLDAALAAVSTLDDMLAEQEAAEQAELARQQAEADAVAEREARLQNPESFFPMPALTTLQRGRLDSVVPALVLIVAGAWLTFAQTTGASQPVLLVLVVALAIILLARWLASGRWALGVLFVALTLLLTTGIFTYLLANALLLTAWPLLIAGVGGAFMLTGLLGGENRLLLPGLILAFGGGVALTVTNQMLPAPLLEQLALWWPAAVVIVLIVLGLPLVARR
jgi:hypothetical protein